MWGVVVSVYNSFVGMAASMRLKARRWSSVGSASLSMVTSVSPKVTVLRVRVARWLRSVSKLCAGVPVAVRRVEAFLSVGSPWVFWRLSSVER